MSTIRKVKAFTDETVNNLLKEYYDEESFQTVVEEVVNRTLQHCAFLIDMYVMYRIPASEYKDKLLNMHDP